MKMGKKWNLKDEVYNSRLTIDELIHAIDTFDVLQEKYPNDEIIEGAIEILRQEICLMFGGTIYND